MRQIMFSEPKINLTNDLSKRGYVTFHLNGNRYREYNGKKLNLDINPNHFKSYNDRLRMLKKLAAEIAKALEKGWNPSKDEKIVKVAPLVTIKTAMYAVLQPKFKL
jgi:hypothetical protein